jgi:hypothetical protein
MSNRLLRPGRLDALPPTIIRTGGGPHDRLPPNRSTTPMTAIGGMRWCPLGTKSRNLSETMQRRGASTFFARHTDDDERLIVDRKPFHCQIVKRGRP